LRYEWSYLILAVSPLTGELKWEWIERMRQEQILAVLKEWDLEVVVWDRAPSRRANSLKGLATERVFLPSYSPELDPAERIFEEVRRRAEGRTYESLEEKETGGGELPQRAGDGPRTGQELMRLGVAQGSARIATYEHRGSVMRATIARNRYKPSVNQLYETLCYLLAVAE